MVKTFILSNLNSTNQYLSTKLILTFNQRKMVVTAIAQPWIVLLFYSVIINYFIGTLLIMHHKLYLHLSLCSKQYLSIAIT